MKKSEKALNSYLKGIEASKTLGITYQVENMKEHYAAILSNKKEFKKAKAILLDAIRECLETKDDALMPELLSEYKKLFPSDIPSSNIPPASSPAETARAILELNEDKQR